MVRFTQRKAATMTAHADHKRSPLEQIETPTTRLRARLVGTQTELDKLQQRNTALTQEVADAKVREQHCSTPKQPS